MRKFVLHRTEDVSGVSGTGVVAEGIVFSDGQAAMRWLNSGSICIYQDAETLEQVHGHQGRTTLMFEEEAQ